MEKICVSFELENGKHSDILYFLNFQTKKYADVIIPRGADNIGKNYFF